MESPTWLCSEVQAWSGGVPRFLPESRVCVPPESRCQGRKEESPPSLSSLSGPRRDKVFLEPSWQVRELQGICCSNLPSALIPTGQGRAGAGLTCFSLIQRLTMKPKSKYTGMLL